jgi:predicted acylesterase/phospholipase RssA/CRP-like cAMP-binding protein
VFVVQPGVPPSEPVAIDALLLDAVGEAFERLDVPRGQALFRQGDDGDALYVLLEGALDVTVKTVDGTDVHVDALLPRAVVGEMALLSGQPRSATVTAAEDARLLRVSRERFVALAESEPDLVERITASIAHRLRRTHLTSVLTDWFGAQDVASFRAIEDELQWVHLAGGQTLFRQDDAGSDMFLVVSGRIQLVDERSGRLLAEVGRGESLGELSALAEERRNGTARAVRDADLVRLPRSLVERHPRLLLRLARAIAARAAGRVRAPVARAKTFALVALSDDVPLAAFTERLREALADRGSTLRLDAERFDASFGKAGAAQLPREHPLSVTVTSWLSERERITRHVVYQADRAWSGWTQRCVRQADRVVLVAMAGSDPDRTRVEEAIESVREGGRLELVLLHPDGTELPHGTLAWLEPRALAAHHHVRPGHEIDLERLARALTGSSLGLVCSGGGARGYVHIGLLRACEELDVPIDVVGGTSMGALIGAAYALSRQSSFCYEQASRFGDPRRIIDFTFPFVALTKSGGLTTILRSIFGDVRIEDMWLPFFCVSTNLSRGERTVHERGPLWQAVRASLAIPGVFTPVLQDGELLVDGGITSNYPVDVMRERPGIGIVVGSNAFPRQENSRQYDFGEAVSGWRLLWRLVNPFTRRPDVPSIIETLVGATSINSRYLVQAMEAMADVSLSYPVESFDPLGFDRYEELVAIGHDVGQQVLAGWMEELGPEEA